MIYLIEKLKSIKELYLSSNLRKNVIKLITSISVFTLTVFFTPNFNIISFPILILSSITIIILEDLTNTVLRTDDIEFGKGIIGFTIATLIIYITQYFVKGYYISIPSTLIASAIYGIFSSMINER